jgi:hypothetical protein
MNCTKSDDQHSEKEAANRTEPALRAAFNTPEEVQQHLAKAKQLDGEIADLICNKTIKHTAIKPLMTTAADGSRDVCRVRRPFAPEHDAGPRATPKHYY